jgi:anti-anti-sigma factor
VTVTHVGRRRRRDAFTVDGDLDPAAADVLFDALLPAVLSVDSDAVLINMAGVARFDASGVEVLVELGDLAGVWGKDILLIAPPERVTRLIRRVGGGQRLRSLVVAGSRTTYLRL